MEQHDDESKQINSLKQLQKMLGGIIKRHEKDERLALAALANPILALEKMGYRLSPELREEIELRTRFGEEKSKQLLALRESVHKAAGKKFDLDSPAELRAVLAETLGAREVRVELPPLQFLKKTRKPDPLVEHADRHPMMKPLLEYRALESSQPRLASKEMFDKIHSGKKKLPIAITRVKFRLRNSG